MSLFRPITAAFAAFVVSALPVSAENPARESYSASEIAAEVNGHPIYRSQVISLAAARAGDDLPQFTREDIQAIKKQVVEDLIDRALLLEAAASAVPQPSAAAVQKLLSEALKAEGKDLSELSKQLGQASEDKIRDELRDDLRIRSYFEKIESSITVTDELIRSVYEEEKENLKEPLQFHLRQILLELPADSTERQEARNKAAELAADIRSGKISFDDAVRQFSIGPARDRGGDLGFVSENQIPEQLLPAISKLQTGIVSDPMESSSGIHLVIVTARRGGTIPPLDKAAPDLRLELIRTQRDQTIEQLLEQKRAAAKIIRYFD